MNAKPCLTLLAFWSLLWLGVLNGTSAKAQKIYEVTPEDERDVCFFYMEFGLPNAKEPKLVIFTSYIYRYKYTYGDYRYPTSNSGLIRTMLTNALHDKIDEIVRNEYRSDIANSFNQVGYKPHLQAEWAYHNGSYAVSTGPDIYQTLESTTVLLTKVREKLIDQFREQGYHIFQTDFDEYWDEDIQELRLEKVQKLSPTYVETYNAGDLKAIARPYQDKSSSSSSSKKSSSSSSKESEEDKEARYKLEAYKANLRQGIIDQYALLKRYDANPLHTYNGYSAEDAVNNLIRSAEDYLANWGYHSQIESILKEAQGWTTAGRAAFVATHAPQVIADLAKDFYFEVEYSAINPNKNTYTPKDAYRIYFGTPSKDAINDNELLAPGFSLSYLKHPVRRYIKEYDASGQQVLVENPELTSFTTGWRLGFQPKLNKFISLKITADIDASFDFSEDTETTPRPSFMSFIVAPKAGIGFNLGNTIQISGGYGMIYAPLFNASEGEYMYGQDGGGEYTIKGYENGKEAIYQHWTVGLRVGF